MGIMVDADFVFHGGKVITIDEKKPRAQGVAVKDGRILWVGTDDEVRQAIGKGTRVWDLKGMTVVPGFIESHNHTLMFGLGLSAIDLTKAGSIEEILALVRERASRQDEGTWIIGVGYNQNELKEKRHPTCQDLDRAAPKHLVSLRHTSAHAVVVNNLALTKAGITKNCPDPAGGKIGRDVETGELTGLLFESPAMKLVEDHMPKPGMEDLITALGRASQRFLAEGITSAMEAGVGINDIPLQIAAYQEAVERGVLRVRHNLAVWSEAVFDYTRFDESLEEAKTKLLGLGIRTGLGDERLRIGPFKIIVDGAFSTVTAVTYEPYGVDPNDRGCGVLVVEPEKLARLASLVHSLGWQLSIHGIGDRAIDVCLDAFEAASRSAPRNRRPAPAGTLHNGPPADVRSPKKARGHSCPSARVHLGTGRQLDPPVGQRKMLPVQTLQKPSEKQYSHSLQLRPPRGERRAPLRNSRGREPEDPNRAGLRPRREDNPGGSPALLHPERGLCLLRGSDQRIYRSGKAGRPGRPGGRSNRGQPGKNQGYIR